VNAVFEVVNDGVLPIADIEVVANLPFGLGVIEAVTAEGDVELRGQGSNAATWNIPALGVGERRLFTLRYRSASTLGLNTTIPLTVQTSSIDDTNTANNSASFNASIVQGFAFPSSDQQPEKLSVTVTTDPAIATIGQTVDLVIRVENLSGEPLYNLSGFTPLLGTQYPNVAFTWNTPTQPGYLAPAGSGDASFAIARIPYAIPENYPVGLNRVVAVQAIDDDPSNGSTVVARDSLTDAELGIRGPILQTSLAVNPTTAVDGQTVTFTLTVSNSSAATDTATNLQVTGNFINGTQILALLLPGASTSLEFTRMVTLADAPQITAQVLLTGEGETQNDVLINRTLRAAVAIFRPVVPNSANLTFAASPTLVFLPGRTTPLPLTVVNNGEQNADAVRLRVNVPFGIEPDPASLGSGVYDAAARVITWDLGTFSVGARQTFTPAFIPPANAVLGTTLVIDATLSTDSNEITLDDNVIESSGVVALPAPAQVTVNPTPRNWLVGDDRDQLTLTVTVFDQLGAPLAGVIPTFSASLPGVNFIGAINPTDAAGATTTTVRATGVGAVNVIATFANGVSSSTTLNRRASAVEITHSPASIGIGGTDRYNLFVVNTATLPDGTTSTGDLVDLTFTLPPELPAEWFTFAQPTLPLGFGDFTETQFTVSIPPASAVPDCQALVGTYPFTVTATGRTLGIVGQAQGTLNIVAQPPELTSVVPNADGRVGGDRVLFGWRSNTPGISTVYYRRQGEAAYTTLPLTADTRDPRLYSAAVDVSADAEGTVFEWYGTIDNGCTARSIGSAADPQTFTRVRSTTFLDPAYAFRVADGYDLTVGDDLNTGEVRDVPLTIRVRNDDDQARAILLDVENPYEDLILGFTGSGSVDQVLLLQPGQTFDAPLRVFTQATEREVYSLSIRLENDRGDVDRIPLVIEIRQPNLVLDIQMLSVDPRTLVTTARLTNRGDTLTDLALDIVQDSTGIPANFVIQPDIQHTYLLAGQSLEIAFIPLDLQDGAAEIFSQLASGEPSLASIPGPYRVTASARRTVIPNVTLRDGTLTNTCPAQRVVADCTTPAGSETRIINDWYCTNKPDIDVPVSLALPNGGLGVPVTRVSAGANFSPGGGVYTHSTTVSLNGSLVGSAIVPSVARIQNDLAPQSLILGGSSPTQLLSLRSMHTNGTHYTVASGFTVTVKYDEHTRTGCFTQAEVDTAAASGGPLMCMPSAVLAVPEQELELRLFPAEDEQLARNEDDAYIVPSGRQITLNAEIVASGIQNITEPVTIELTVPDGITPRGMTIQDEDQTFLDILFALLNAVNPDLAGLVNAILGIDIADQQTTFTYTLENGVTVGQPFPITLEVVGDEAGRFEVSGTASIQTAFVLDEDSATDLMTTMQAQLTPMPTLLPLQVVYPTCTITVASGRNISYFDSPLKMLGQQTAAGNLPSGTIIEVDLRSFINPNVVRISANATDAASVGRWFYTGDGNVTQSPEQLRDTPCSRDGIDVLTTETIDATNALVELQEDYGVLLRNEGSFVWTETEIVEIYKGVVSTAAALDRLSSSTLTTAELFRQIMTSGDLLPYIILYKGQGVQDNLSTPEVNEAIELAVTFTVPTPTTPQTLVPISFGNDINDDVDNVTNGGCITFQGTGARTDVPSIPRTIVCNSLPITAGGEMILAGAGGQANLSFTQYLLVHELGHIFDNRTSSTSCLTSATTPTNPASPNCRLLNLAFQGVSSSACPVFLSDMLRQDNASPQPTSAPALVFRTTCVDVVDRLTFRVIGPRSDLNGIYGRRDRGWGTGPDNIFTDFQQHPSEVFSILTARVCPSEDIGSSCYDPSIVLEEEAADMFLNWIYRTLSNIPFSYLTELPGTWNGFRNQSWGTYGSNSYDGNDYLIVNGEQENLFSGDARLEWMQIVMQNIFDEKGW